MENFDESIQDHIASTTGAACFSDIVTSDKHCANDLTYEQAQSFASNHNLNLDGWFQGQSCSDIDCG